MKHRRAAPQGAPEQEPVTFIDVVSCFSEEEWKLLHNWQKELYRNVMKDIHQALLSLGPMIANSVFSLNPKGHEELCDMDFEDMKFNRDLKTFQGYSAGESNALSRKTRLAKQHLKNISDTNERGSCDRPSTAGPMMASSLLSRTPKGHEELCNLEVEDIKLNHDVNTYRGNSTGDSNTSFRKTRIASEHLKDSPVTNERGSHDMSSTDTAPTDSASLKEECDVETLDYSQPQGTKCPSGTTRPEVTRPAVSVSVVDDEESYAIETQDYGEEDVSSPVEPGDAMPYVPMGINEEGETYPIDIEDYGKSEGTSSYVGEDARTFVNEESVTYDGTSLPRKDSSENVKVVLISEAASDSRIGKWSASSRNLGDVKASKSDSDFVNKTHSSYYEGICKQIIYFGDNMPNAEKTSGHNASPKCNYECKECKKCFRSKGHLISHERTHSGEKPYHCSVCDKSFSQRHRLLGHERTHSGEKPFQCVKCNRTFTWRDSLRRHYRTHTGERPYQCTTCMKCFGQKETLVKHMETHTRHQQADPSLK